MLEVFLDGIIPGHKLVFTARSKLWDEEFLSNHSELDWTDIEPDVAIAIILWMYKVSI